MNRNPHHFVYSVELLDHISNQNVEVVSHCPNQYFFGVQCRRMTSFHRTATTASAKHRIRCPRLEPTLQVTQPTRSPKWIGVPTSVPHHDNIRIQQSITPCSITCKKGKNGNQTIEPRLREGLQAQQSITTSSFFFDTHRISKHSTCETKKLLLLQHTTARRKRFSVSLILVASLGQLQANLLCTSVISTSMEVTIREDLELRPVLERAQVRTKTKRTYYVNMYSRENKHLQQTNVHAQVRTTKRDRTRAKRRTTIQATLVRSTRW